MLKGLMKQYNPTFVRLNSDIDDQCIRRSWPWAQVRPLLIFYAHRRSKVTRYIMARNRMRSSGRHSNETTKSKERKDGRYTGRAKQGEEEGEGEGETREKKVRLWKGKKRGRNVEMQTDGVLRSSLVSQLRKLPEESYQEPFSTAGRSPHARSLPTLSTNGYL